MKTLILPFILACLALAQEKAPVKSEVPPAIAAPEAPAPIPVDQALEVSRWQTIASMKAIEAAQAVACSRLGGVYAVNAQNFSASCTPREKPTPVPAPAPPAK